MTTRLLVGGYGSSIGAVGWSETGFGSPTAVASADRPSYLVTSTDSRYAYAVLERDEGAVAAWEVSAEGSWRALGEQPTGGSSPCHLALSPDGRWLLSANYGSGSVCVHRVESDGSLGVRTDLVQHAGHSGPVADRQDGPHAHQVVFIADDLVLACDLGLDAVILYRLDHVAGLLSEVGRRRFAPGTGPRHLAWSADRHQAYVVGELSSTLSVCFLDGLDLVVQDTVPTRSPGAIGDNLPAGVVVDGAGDVVVSNRGDDTLATIVVAQDPAELGDVFACGGEWPRFVGCGPGDRLLVANERSDRVSVLSRGSGGWELSGGFDWPAPTCVVVLP